jgi:hypothetical protein
MSNEIQSEILWKIKAFGKKKKKGKIVSILNQLSATTERSTGERR